MSGSAPPLDPVPGRASRSGRSRRVWWWLLVAILVVAGVTALAVRPWEPVETEPPPTATLTDVPTAAPTTPSAPSSSSPAVPGADAVFDATTAPALFVSSDDLLADVPAAEPVVEQRITSGQMPWGLPVGSTVDPPACTVALTVVPAAPPWYDALLWGNETLSFEQEVLLLADPTAARDAFRQLVTAVDACPQYSQQNPGMDGATWIAEPAIEGQGVFPSIVQEMTHSAEGYDVPGYRGHTLVGNAIVTWTAEALTVGDRQAALATLGDPTGLSAMVQERAQAAVKALG
ncbi:hypothetical protein [uncultured Cellulomonas sp.]|uniref:hypothetical protein n=1 Tax=uncultured Cellulomonas sp. TaxID=189682 RepID=UPI0028EE5755|nr:hypothetical protein [uncultured Cellulomonas sp.]